MVQIARPDSDISTGLWGPIGGPSTLFEAIDEVTPDDNDYIEALNGENTTCELGLTTITDPTASTGHIIRFRIQGTGSGAPERCEVELYDGATLIAGTGTRASRAAWSTEVYTLSEPETNNIGDYSDLRFKIISSNLGGTEDMWCSFAEFEVPDAAGLSQTVNQVTETDLAQTIAAQRVYDVLQVTETDLAQPMGIRRSYDIGQVTETDLAQSIGLELRRLVTQVTETDLSQPMTVRRSYNVGQVTETDLAQSILVNRAFLLGQVIETDLAQPLTRVKTLIIGQVFETDLARVITAFLGGARLRGVKALVSLGRMMNP